ncbi:uncharacterized protein LOC123658519 [Melitaea cinxia]|uniref:uncharacterized protein LOC123658519 n=1 Tax=Melitaea cinxia TaxID=113334 RepID=UPI001E26E9F7|nr:uncharacterized protein LOC123658519 [Melitaea cinxia]
MKQKQYAAYNTIVQEMNIVGFGIQEVKNKIKKLQSTYQQENKKIQDSKNFGAGRSNVYTSNIKWLNEMKEVFSKDLNKNVYENNRHPTNEESSSRNISFSSTSLSNNNKEVPVTATTTNTTATTSNTENTVKADKMTREIFQTVSDLKKLYEGVSFEKETVFDMFGRSVVLRLKNLSAENALLAQTEIQNILTQYGIKELRQRTASHSSSSNHN